MVEQHPLEPFVPDGAKILILGSFPPPRNKWSMEFFYPNFINDFWRICGLVFFNDKDHFIKTPEVSGDAITGNATSGKMPKRFDKEKIVAFCRERGIALYDTASAVRRLKGNASDNFLEVATPTDISALLSRMPDCQAIAVTGQKALETFLEANSPIAENTSEPFKASDIKIGEAFPILINTCSEGSSRKYRRVMFFRMPSTSRAYPLSLEKKAAFYRNMFLSIWRD